MNTMKKAELINKKAARSERGAAMIDYAILTSLVAVVSLGSLVAFSNQIQRVICEDVMKIHFINEKETPRIVWDDTDPDNKFCSAPDWSANSDPLF